MEAENPFDLAGRTALSAVTLRQKLWVIRQVRDMHIAPSAVCARCDLNLNTVYAWITKSDQGRLLHSGGGRPRALDPESIACILNLVADEGPQYDEEVLRTAIRSEALKTWQRRYGGDHRTFVYKQMSSKTIYNYSQKIHCLVQELS